MDRADQREGEWVGDGRVKGNVQRERRRSEDVPWKRDKKKRAVKSRLSLSPPLLLSLPLSTDYESRSGDVVSMRSEKGLDESEGREIEEEGFVAERDFQRSQLLDASRAAGRTAGYRVSSRCIDIREFREFRFPRHSRACRQHTGFTNQLGLDLFFFIHSCARAKWFPIDLSSKPLRMCKSQCNHNR